MAGTTFRRCRDHRQQIPNTDYTAHRTSKIHKVNRTGSTVSFLLKEVDEVANIFPNDFVSLTVKREPRKKK